MWELTVLMFLLCANDFITAKEIGNHETSPSTNQITLHAPPASNSFNKTTHFISQLEVIRTTLENVAYWLKYSGRLLWGPLRNIPSMGPEDPLTLHCKISFSWEADGIYRLLHLPIVLKQGTYESLCPFSEIGFIFCQRTRTSADTLLRLGIMLAFYVSIK